MKDWDARAALRRVVLCRDPHDAACEPRPALPPEVLAGLVGLARPTESRKKSARADRARVDRVVKATGVGAILARPHASGRPLQAQGRADWTSVALCRALCAVRPDDTFALLLDNPTGSLTVAHEAAFLEFLCSECENECDASAGDSPPNVEDHGRTGAAVVLSASNAGAARHVHRAVVLHPSSGCVVEEGEVAVLLRDPNSALSRLIGTADGAVGSSSNKAEEDV